MLYPSEWLLKGDCDAPTDANDVTDATLVTTLLSTNQLVGAYVKIYDATDAAPEGETRRITAFDKTAGVMSVDSAFTVATAASDKYEIHYLHPRVIEDAIDYALEIGSNRAFAAIGRTEWDEASDQEETKSVYNEDVLYQGALARIKNGQANRVTGEERQRLLDAATAHRRNWERGLEILGYRKPAPDKALTTAERLRRI
jgi:hypothetical protein